MFVRLWNDPAASIPGAARCGPTCSPRSTAAASTWSAPSRPAAPARSGTRCAQPDGRRRPRTRGAGPHPGRAVREALASCPTVNAGDRAGVLRRPHLPGGRGVCWSNRKARSRAASAPGWCGCAPRSRAGSRDERTAIGRELGPAELHELLGAYALDAVDADEREQVEAYLETHRPSAPPRSTSSRRPRRCWRSLARSPTAGAARRCGTASWSRSRPTRRSGRRSGPAASRAPPRAYAVARSPRARRRWSPWSRSWSVLARPDGRCRPLDRRCRLGRLARRAALGTRRRPMDPASHARGRLGGGDARASSRCPTARATSVATPSPALAPGRTYQLWAMTGSRDAPVVVSVGVLGAAPTSTASARAAPAGFTVTVEARAGCRRARRPPVRRAGADLRAPGRVPSGTTQFGVYVHIPFCAAAATTATSRPGPIVPHLIDEYVDACVRRPRAPTRATVPRPRQRVLRRRHAVAAPRRPAAPHPRRDPARRRRRGHRRVQPRLASTPRKLAAYRGGGVNRVSFGVQSMRRMCSPRSAGRTIRRTSTPRRRAGARRRASRVQPRPDLRHAGRDARRLAARRSTASSRSTAAHVERVRARRSSPGRRSAGASPPARRRPTTTTRPTKYELADERLARRRARVVRDLELGPRPVTSAATTSSTGRGRVPAAIGCAAHGHTGGRALVERAHARALHRRRDRRPGGRRRPATRRLDRRRPRRGSARLALRTRRGARSPTAAPSGRWSTSSRPPGWSSRVGGPDRPHPPHGRLLAVRRDRTARAPGCWHSVPLSANGERRRPTVRPETG